MLLLYISLSILSVPSNFLCWAAIFQNDIMALADSRDWRPKLWLRLVMVGQCLLLWWLLLFFLPPHMPEPWHFYLMDQPLG